MGNNLTNHLIDAGLSLSYGLRTANMEPSKFSVFLTHPDQHIVRTLDRMIMAELPHMYQCGPKSFNSKGLLGGPAGQLWGMNVEIGVTPQRATQALIIPQ